MNLQPDSDPTNVLISDFDGTMTQHDFYQLAIQMLLPPETPDYWAEYRAGTITHFEALRRYFAAIRGSEEDVLAVVRQMNPDRALPEAVRDLREAGWHIVVASAGCEWYIQQLLSDAGVAVEVHANPGYLQEGNGLQMVMPAASPWHSATLGINKTAIVRHWLAKGVTVAFAGDGYPDADPARLVQADLRFARGDLAGLLEQEGLKYHRFTAWSEIARVLLQRNS